MSKVIVNNKVKEVITLNNLLPHFHLQKYLPLFQKHNIDLKIFLTMNEQNLQSIGIKDETHRKILLICIQKIPEILTAKEVKDPMILITHDNEINNVINADDSSSDDCYESEENQSEDDDRTTIATFEEETVIPTTKVIKEEGNDDVIDNGIDNDIDNDSDNENDIDNDISNDIDNDIDNDIENDACNEVDAIEQYENRRLMETIKEGDSDNEIVRREVESDVINSLPDIDVINSLPDIDEIPNDSPPPYSSPYSSPYSPPSQGQITTTSLSFKNVIKKSSSFWKNRKQSYENILSNRLARDRNKGYKLPSYSESLSCEEEQEELPGYSCSVDKAGYLMKKNEMISDEQKANVRSWGKIYFYLWGTFVKIYKSEPNNIKRASPICQFSMNGAKVSIALDYSKKRNVLRIRLLNGRSYLFQAPDRCEFISWIEKLQSSANISSTIDEREMPMFITLPTRRRRGSQQQQPQLQEEVAATTRTTISSVIRTRARSTFGNSRNNNGINSRSSSRSSSSGSNNSRMLMSITTSGLTYQHFNDLARDLQLVQVVDVLPQQQLLW